MLICRYALLRGHSYVHAGISFMFIGYCTVESFCEAEIVRIFTIEMPLRRISSNDILFLQTFL